MLLIYYSILGIHVLACIHLLQEFLPPIFTTSSLQYFLVCFSLAFFVSCHLVLFSEEISKISLFWSQQLVRSQYFLLYQTSLLRLSSRIFLTLSLITFQLPSPYTAFIQPLSLLWFLLPALLSEQSTQHVMFLPSFPDRLEAVTLFYITFLSCSINN